MCVIWNTDVGRALKYSTLLLMGTQRSLDSSCSILLRGLLTKVAVEMDSVEHVHSQYNVQ